MLRYVLILGTIVLAVMPGSCVGELNSSTPSLSVSLSESRSQVRTQTVAPWIRTQTLPAREVLNVTPAFEPSLGDLGGEGATFVLGIVLGSIVLLFANVFCCCNHVLREATAGSKVGVASHATEIELDAMGDDAGYLTPEPQSYSRAQL